MNWEQILTGDCMAILPTLEAESVQTCVTSPPYWGLRDYGTASWEGGDTGCEHVDKLKLKRDNPGGGLSVSLDTTRGNQTSTTSSIIQFRNVCLLCGARRIDSQLGLESTPEEYLAKMVAVFREVWRVLRDDGTCWINLGDSYGTGGSGQNFYDPNGERPGGGRLTQEGGFGHKKSNGLRGMHKQLLGIPWRVAFALQADGWYLRSDIIWHKPNPMPESVTDRPTKAHEYIFLLTKAERYFYDAEAIREPQSEGTLQRFGNGNTPRKTTTKAIAADNQFNVSANANYKNAIPLAILPDGNRNKRTVWTVATQPYGEAHFATFPEDLIKPCIMAGSRLGDTVLDPFAGSGTTGKVALELGRKVILIELNPAYIELAQERTFTTPGFL
jgi:DNA modification methylase